MMNESGKNIVFLTLIGIPLSLIVALIIMYIAMFGFQVPFNIHFKSETPDGKLIDVAGTVDYKTAIADSIEILRSKLTNMENKSLELQKEIDSWNDSLQVLQRKANSYTKEFSSYQKKYEDIKSQMSTKQQERVERLAKIFKSLSEGKIDSLYVASLDDYTLMSILDVAKSEQAAAIFEKVDPKRAARLTSNYIKKGLK